MPSSDPAAPPGSADGARWGHFPPRSELPPGVVIERLPFVGTTWYERGPSYWARRAAMVAVAVVVLAIYAALISGFVRGAGPVGSPGFLAALTAESVFSLVSGVLAFRHYWRRGVSGRLSKPSRAGRRGAAAAGGGLAVASAGVAGAFLLVVSGLLTAGFMLAVTAIALAPALPIEQYARQQLAETLKLPGDAHHPHHPAAQRSKHWGSH